MAPAWRFWIATSPAEQTCAFANNGINLARAWRCDVTESDILDTVSAVIHEFSGIDILFNNAGVNRRIKLSDLKADDWNALIQVNLIGVFCVARAVGLHMVERGRGKHREYVGTRRRNHRTWPGD